jgi:hypothetical protein
MMWQPTRQTHRIMSGLVSPEPLSAYQSSLFSVNYGMSLQLGVRLRANVQSLRRGRRLSHGTLLEVRDNVFRFVGMVGR